MAQDEVCKHCDREIYYWSNGWLPKVRGSWYHYHNDKEHCSYPHRSYAEPNTSPQPADNDAEGGQR